MARKTTLKMQIPYIPKGFPVWYELSDDASVEEWSGLLKVKMDGMIAAGSVPSMVEDLEGFLKANREAAEFVSLVFFKNIGEWLMAHVKTAPHSEVFEESEHYLTMINFETPEGQASFLSDHPLWVSERPKQWYDNRVVPVVDDDPDDEGE